MNPSTIAKRPYCSLPRLRTRVGVDTNPSSIGKSHAPTLKSEFAANAGRFFVLAIRLVRESCIVRRDRYACGIALVKILYHKCSALRPEVLSKFGFVLQFQYCFR